MEAWSKVDLITSKASGGKCPDFLLWLKEEGDDSNTAVAKGFKFIYKKVVREGLENGKRLVFLHMDGCGHCEKFMPEWKKATASNKTDIKMVDYESSTPEGSKLAKEHGVTGFPSVMLLSNTKKDYDGERTESGLLSFLEANK